MVMAALVVDWPALSVAIAVSVRAPSPTLLESQVTAQPSPPFVSTPIDAPSTRNSTRATPMSSLAVATTLTRPATVVVAPGLVIATVGGLSTATD